MTLQIAVVCEAPADRLTATELADRILCALVDWISEEVLDEYRQWRGLQESEPHLRWDDVPRLAQERKIRAHGHFGGAPGAPDAHTARLAHPRRECWVLSGFEPRDEREQQRIAQAREELAFDPCLEAVRLNDRHPHEPRSAKRVLALLTGGDHERECHCWRSTTLAVLEERGKRNGLTEYLREVRERLLPLFLPGPVASPRT